MTSRAKKKLDDRFTREMSEAAEGMRSLGVMDEATYKLTMRDLNRAAPEETVTPLTGEEIRELRERAHMSQAVFARFLHRPSIMFRNLNAGPNARPARPWCCSISFAAKAWTRSSKRSRHVTNVLHASRVPSLARSSAALSPPPFIAERFARPLGRA